MASLSSTGRIPSRWAPSRSVVSNNWNCSSMSIASNENPWPGRHEGLRIDRLLSGRCACHNQRVKHATSVAWFAPLGVRPPGRVERYVLSVHPDAASSNILAIPRRASPRATPIRPKFC